MYEEKWEKHIDYRKVESIVIYKFLQKFCELSFR
jgi:hypothetical protein